MKYESADEKARVKNAEKEENVEYIKNLSKHYSETFSRLRQVAEKTDSSYFSVLVDYAFAILLFGEDIDHYIEEFMYRFGVLEKSRRMSYRRLDRLDRLGNKDAKWSDFQSLNIKNLFVKRFAEFTGRETIFVPDCSDDEVRAFMEKHRFVVAKPVDKCSGEGVFGFDVSELTDERIKFLRDNAYVLDQRIIQHPEMSRINASSVNTVRVVTVTDKSGKAHVINTFIRAGLPGNITDNTCTGGITYPVDEELGIIPTFGYADESWERYMFHKGTGTLMPGFKVPNFDKVLEVAKRAAETIPSVRYIGWDVAVRENDAVLIEGNTFPQTQELDGRARYRKAMKYMKS